MVPEYAEKVTGQGKAEDLGRKALLTESLDIFKFQQETAHKNNIKVTIQMTYASLFNEEAVALAKEHHEKYGDEIALSLLGLPCEEFREKYKTKDFCIWMFSMEDKKQIVDDVFGKFYDAFGFYPESTGSYYMDADLTNYIKEKYPSVIATELVDMTSSAGDWNGFLIQKTGKNSFVAIGFSQYNNYPHHGFMLGTSEHPFYRGKFTEQNWAENVRLCYLQCSND